MTTPVPNYFPPSPSKPRLAVVGEAPGEDEVREGVPFVGKTGQLLRDMLAGAGLDLDCVFRGNVSQHRPEGNKFSLFDWDGPEVQSGMSQLKVDLKRFKPSIVLLLGAQPLRAAMSAKLSITDYRGTVLRPTNGSPMRDFVCLPTYHPAACFRDNRLKWLIRGDLKRALHILKGGDFSPPAEDFLLDPSESEIVSCLARLRKSRAKCALDIEGYPGDIRCLSIAWSPSEAIVIPREHIRLAQLAAYLDDASCPKVFHNGLYDLFVLAYKPYNLRVKGVTDDTMFAEWELACELPKGLDHCASLHTWRPYWKADRTANDPRTLYRYCSRDSTATLEILDAQQRLLLSDHGSRRHYDFNVSLIDPLLYMELRGISYAVEKAAARKERLQNEMWEAQADLNDVAGNRHDVKALKDHVLLLTQKRLNLTDFTKLQVSDFLKPWQGEAPRFLELLGKATLTKAEKGELSTRLKHHRNVDSPTFKDYLYETLKLPKQFNKTATGFALTADESALLKLRRKTKSPVIPLALKIRSLGTRVGMLGISADPDGRIRCAYNPVGQETGRVSCYKSPTGSGYNLTTIPEGDRDLFQADPNHWLCQCDLEGADGWTVAANLVALGNPTMFEDLKFGLRPAKNLVIMRENPDAFDWTRDQLAVAGKAVLKSDPKYFIAKKAQHATSYLMGARACVNAIFLESGGEILVSEAEASAWQEILHRRYGIRLWHAAVARNIRLEPVMRAPSGHVRRLMNFHDRRLTEALAHEPQANTTYATNMALKRLWEDVSNWPSGHVGEGKPIVEPLHHIHDALLFSFPKHKLAFARKKLQEWFNNPIVIAGMAIVIPFEGKYGPSWGELTEGKI